MTFSGEFRQNFYLYIFLLPISVLFTLYVFAGSCSISFYDAKKRIKKRGYLPENPRRAVKSPRRARTGRKEAPIRLNLLQRRRPNSRRTNRMVRVRVRTLVVISDRRCEKGGQWKTKKKETGKHRHSSTYTFSGTPSRDVFDRGAALLREPVP